MRELLMVLFMIVEMISALRGPMAYLRLLVQSARHMGLSDLVPCVLLSTRRCCILSDWWDQKLRWTRGSWLFLVCISTVYNCHWIQILTLSLSCHSRCRRSPSCCLLSWLLGVHLWLLCSLLVIRLLLLFCNTCDVCPSDPFLEPRAQKATTKEKEKPATGQCTNHAGENDKTIDDIKSFIRDQPGFSPFLDYNDLGIVINLRSFKQFLVRLRDLLPKDCMCHL